LNSEYDAIVIGGGHNGLVTACYLARAKWRVLVLERRYIVGGACVTEEVFPGFKVSTAAYVNSLFRPEIIADLRLRDYGFEAIERNPASFSPFLDGRYFILGPATKRCSSASLRSSSRRSPRFHQICFARASRNYSRRPRWAARCNAWARQWVKRSKC
jgi:phytoene dehydrogenase-like protein